MTDPQFASPDEDLLDSEPIPTVPRWAKWLGAGLVLAVLSGAAVALSIDALSGDRGNASAVLDDYLAAIEAGDAEEANGLARLNRGAPENVVLASDALAEAETITDAKTARLSVDAEAGEGKAEVAFELDGRHYTETLRLERDDDGWYVSEGLVYELGLYTYAVNPAGLEGFEGDVPFDEVYGDSGPYDMWGDSDRSVQDGAVTAYPGIYQVVASNDYYDLVSGGRLEVSPRAAERASYDEWVEPNDAYFEEVDRQIEEWYDDCAALGTVGELRECGILVSTYDGDGALPPQTRAQVTIEQYPTFEDFGGWGEVDFDGALFSAELVGNPSAETYVAWQNAELYIEVVDGELLIEFEFLT